jgi:MtrB/PioB family decaheme-associated outer membrane protein
MRTLVKLLPILVVALLAVVFPVWSQESQPEQTPDEKTTTSTDQTEQTTSTDQTEQTTTTSTDQTEQAPTTSTPEQAASTEMSSDEVSTSIDSEISVWTSHAEDDSSKAEEYGEIPDGFLVNYLSANILMKDDRQLGVRARNVGLNNGIYGFDYGVIGRYKLFVDYRKIPHLFSKEGETIYNEDSPGVWALGDSVQGAIENLNPFPPVSSDPNYAAALNNQRDFISNLLTQAHPTDLGLMRNRGTAGFAFSPSQNWTYGVEYFRENRDGTRPYGATLGFSWLQELPEHIEYNTDRVRAGLEYAKNGKTFAAAYEFSGFNNEHEVMIWDNPLRLTDRALQTAGDGTSRGRLQLPADNHSNMFSLSASSGLGRGKITGSFAYNTWKNDVDLLPYTINSALPQEPLPSSTFNGDLRNLTVNFRYYSPIGSKGVFTANYRLYDQKNENDELLFTAFSPLDASLTLDEAFNHLTAFKTNTIDLDFQYGLTGTIRWLVGYSFNRWDREEREVEETDTNTFRTGFDWLPADRITLHARYQYDRRKSDHFDLELPVYDVIPLRRFDTANLNRNLFRVFADFAISDSSTLGLTAGFQNNDFPDTTYGLQEGDYWNVGADYSYAISATKTFNIWYEHARNTRDQQGRQSSSSTPSTSTTFDWTAGLEDVYDTVGLGYQMHFREEKCIWNTDVVYAHANGSEDLNAGASIRPTGAVDLNNVDDTEHVSFKTSVGIRLFPRARFVIGYWLDWYTIDDFSENAIQTNLIRVTDPNTGLISYPGVILLNARQPDYTYNSGWLGFTYSW